MHSFLKRLEDETLTERDVLGRAKDEVDQDRVEGRVQTKDWGNRSQQSIGHTCTGEKDSSSDLAIQEIQKHFQNILHFIYLQITGQITFLALTQKSVFITILQKENRKKLK